MKKSVIKMFFLLILLNFSFLAHSQQLDLINSGNLHSGLADNVITYPPGTVNVPSPRTIGNHWTNENGDLNLGEPNALGVKTWYLAPVESGSFVELIQAAVIPHQLK